MRARVIPSALLLEGLFAAMQLVGRLSSVYDSKVTFGQAFLGSALLERFIKRFLTVPKAAGDVGGDMWHIHPVAENSKPYINQQVQSKSWEWLA